MPKHKRDWLFGHHAVEAALRAGKREVYELMFLEQHRPRYAWVRSEYPQLKLTQTDTLSLNRLAPEDQPHQGIALWVGPLPPLTTADLPEDATFLLALDQVTDPHNLGACLRSAAAFGVQGVLVPHNHSGHTSPVVAKAAAGALERVPLIDVGNLHQALTDLKEDGYWIVGLAGEGDKELGSIDLKGKLVIVMGAEGGGLRDLTRKTCDFLARIPMTGEIESLNVSVACGVSLYEAFRQRRKTT